MGFFSILLQYVDPLKKNPAFLRREILRAIYDQQPPLVQGHYLCYLPACGVQVVQEILEFVFFPEICGGLDNSITILQGLRVKQVLQVSLVGFATDKVPSFILSAKHTVADNLIDFSVYHKLEHSPPAKPNIGIISRSEFF